jgi:hypothetical protein
MSRHGQKQWWSLQLSLEYQSFCSRRHLGRSCANETVSTHKATTARRTGADARQYNMWDGGGLDVDDGEMVGQMTIKVVVCRCSYVRAVL